MEDTEKTECEEELPCLEGGYSSKQVLEIGGERTSLACWAHAGVEMTCITQEHPELHGGRAVC